MFFKILDLKKILKRIRFENIESNKNNKNIESKNAIISKNIDKEEDVGKVIYGDNFTMREEKTEYPYNTYIELDKALADRLKLITTKINISLQYLYNKHPDMFKNKRDIYKTIQALIKDHDYAGDSFKDAEIAYISKINNKKMSDMAIKRDTNGVIHLNKNKKATKTDRELAKTLVSSHKPLVLGTLPNPKKNPAGQQPR